MADLKLEFLDDGTTDAGPGRYADKRAFDILQRYLHERVTVREAAIEITAMLPEPKDRNSRGAEVGLFGSFLCQMAQHIPYDNPAQTRLVQLIQRVSQSTKLNAQGDDEGFMISFTMEDFKSQLREWFIPEFEDEPEDEDQYPHALNFAAFLARLTQCGFLSYTSLSIWSLRGSLEEKVDHRESWDCLVSSAALWFILAGQAIYTQVVEVPFHVKAGGLYKPGSLYDGPELAVERWEFWKGALITASNDEKASETCRHLAQVAVDVMNAVDSGMRF